MPMSSGSISRMYWVGSRSYSRGIAERWSESHGVCSITISRVRIMTRKNSKNQSLVSCRMKMSRRSQESMNISSQEVRNTSVSEHSPRTTNEKHTRGKNESVLHVSHTSSSKRWKQIISLLGLSEARRQPRTARCSARIAIAPSQGSSHTFRRMNYKNSLNFSTNLSTSLFVL